jgi:phenylalanyl-tRNA synthetase beta chain
MNLSLNWLNDYTNTETIPLTQLVSGLTMSGSKVEKYKVLSEPLSKIVIGKVTEIKKHENSHKLWICQVQVGNSAEQSAQDGTGARASCCQIVTGAQNVTVGAVVPVVLDGGTVLRDGEAFKINKGKLRGEVSEGMLCSCDELGIDGDADGILLLDDQAQIGGCALEYLGLNDTCIEFEITNNRPDCLAVTGLAREVSAAFDLPLNIPEPKFKGVDCDITKEIDVVLQNKQLCSRYMAGLVKNVKIAPSPRWMASRLKAMGVRPINNIVDITNYVMLEYGHPLHAFDKRFIEGEQIVIRSSFDKEEITLLDGNTVTLTSDILVIADKVKPIAVAGVMGGEFSGVIEDTDTVIFEAACFDGVSVRRASKKIGRRTESSARFEKGLDPVNVKTALLRALQLVEELGIGEVACTLIDCVNFTQEQPSVPHDYAKINRFLGTDISEDEQIGIFKKLGFGYENNQVIVPRTRRDIENHYDLSEEIARIYGYDRIKPTLPRLSVTTKSNDFDNNIRRLTNALAAQSCHECMTYSFVSPRMADENAVKIRNPFGEETGVMRTSMYPSMLKVIADNLNARNTEGRLFEIGRIYTGSREPDMLCIGLYGKDESFYTIKGIVEETLEKFNVEVFTARCTDSPFHPGRAAANDFAKFGEINPLVLLEYGISERVYIAEIDLGKFFAIIKDKVLYTPIPKYPASTRDLSLVCDDGVTSGEIIEIIQKTGWLQSLSHNLLESVEFFDVYKGGNLPDGKKSLSYKLTFRKLDATLTDNEVDESVKLILLELEEKNIKLRG